MNRPHFFPLFSQAYFIKKINTRCCKKKLGPKKFFDFPPLLHREKCIFCIFGSPQCIFDPYPLEVNHPHFSPLFSQAYFIKKINTRWSEKKLGPKNDLGGVFLRERGQKVCLRPQSSLGRKHFQKSEI